MRVLAFLFALLTAAAAGPAAGAPAYPLLPAGGDFQNCSPAAPQARICRVIRDLAPEEAARRLAGRDTAWWVEGDTFSVVTVHDGEELRLCCAIQAPMARLPGTDFWTLTVRIRDLDRAILDVLPMRAGRFARLPEWRGPAAPPPPPVASHLAGRLRSETVTSRRLGGSRRLTVYLPPAHEAAQAYPVVYMADGDTVLGLAGAIEPLILAGRIRPVVLVGLHAGPTEQRHREYLPGYGKGDDGAFARHEAFLIEEVMPLAEARYGAARTPDGRLLIGYSNGAAWAVATALRHPELFGRAAGLSFGWPKAAEPLGGPVKPKLFLAAGTLEGVFWRRTRELASAAGSAGYDVTLVTPVSGHSSVMWTQLYPQVLEWAFRRPAAATGTAAGGR